MRPRRVRALRICLRLAGEIEPDEVMRGCMREYSCTMLVTQDGMEACIWGETIPPISVRRPAYCRSASHVTGGHMMTSGPGPAALSDLQLKVLSVNKSVWCVQSCPSYQVRGS